ncbi:hypothetical protein BS47DRAFT_1141930 [Hydnum rufescens UP504]|uniref:Chromo domain-containing protein n=1 Tax=Hydnum rufescens UP504 TaxID=1448309 RepID=A0A9P6AUF6_9AGAM|nr:hypothetical protein BS47DRAFT_1141930 [Hydnum rufescens UP504]
MRKRTTDFSSLDPLAPHNTVAPYDSLNSTILPPDQTSHSASGISGSFRQPSSTIKKPFDSDLHSRTRNFPTSSNEENSLIYPSKPKKKRRITIVNRKPQPQLTDTKRKRLSSLSNSPRTRVQWPTPTELTFGLKPSLIKCDQCDSWYHTSCVGIEENSQRVDEAIFICPRCQTMGPTYVPRRTSRTATSTCGRPDCKVVKIDIKHEEEPEYVIEAIIGRRPTRFFNKGVWDYLLKWEGYDTNLSTWIPSGEVGGSETLVPRFEAAAEAEGLDLKSLIVFLKSAREAPNPIYER